MKSEAGTTGVGSFGILKRNVSIIIWYYGDFYVRVFHDLMPKPDRHCIVFPLQRTQWKSKCSRNADNWWIPGLEYRQKDFEKKELDLEAGWVFIMKDEQYLGICGRELKESAGLVLKFLERCC